MAVFTKKLKFTRKISNIVDGIRKGSSQHYQKGLRWGLNQWAAILTFGNGACCLEGFKCLAYQALNSTV